ncbi:TPA: DUF3330 domain-containing protein [Legionella pneumophila]
MSKQEKEGCPLCQCATCCKEIPESAAATVEGADYVRHFCSTECYEKWQKQQHKLHHESKEDK